MNARAIVWLVAALVSLWGGAWVLDRFSYHHWASEPLFMTVYGLRIACFGTALYHAVIGLLQDTRGGRK